MLWTALWALWILGFAVIEGVACYRDFLAPGHVNDGRTLSEHLRRWFRVDTHLGRTTWIIASGLFLALFVVHIADGGWG